MCKENYSSKNSFFGRKESQPTISHDIINSTLVKQSDKYTRIQKKAYSENSKSENINNISTTLNTEVSAFDGTNLTHNDGISGYASGIPGKKRMLCSILSAHAFLTKSLRVSEFDLSRLNVILHVFDAKREKFRNLSYADQMSFINEIFEYVGQKPASSSCLKNNPNKKQTSKLSNSKRFLLFITHFLYPHKEMHFSDLFEKVRTVYKLPKYASTIQTQIIYIKRNKRYFIFEKNGLIKLNLAPDANFSTQKPPVDINICISPCEQEEKNLIPTATPSSISDSIIDMCNNVLVSKRMHFEEIFDILRLTGNEEIQSFIKLLNDSEKFKFFQTASHKFEMEKDGYVTLKSCTEQSNIAAVPEKHEQSSNVYSTICETTEDILLLPSSNLTRASNLLTKGEENAHKGSDTEAPSSLCDTLETWNSSELKLGERSKINEVCDIDKVTSMEGIDAIEKKLETLDSKNCNSCTEQNEDMPTNRQKNNSCNSEKIKILSNEELIGISGYVKEIKQIVCSERKDVTEDITCNAQSLKDEYKLDCITDDKNSNDLLATDENVKTENILTSTKTKIALHDYVTNKSITDAPINVSEPTEMYNCCDKNSDLQRNNTALSDSVSTDLKNFENQHKGTKSIKTNSFNKVKNTLCSSNISSDLIKRSQHVLHNFSAVNETDFDHESCQKLSDISSLTNLQRLPKQSSKFVKHPTCESKISLNRSYKKITDMYLKSSTASISCQRSCFESNDGDIKSRSVIFDNISNNECCLETGDSFRSPFNLEMSHSTTFNGVSFCLKELKEQSNFNLSKPEENKYLTENSCLSSVHKNAEKKLQTINFFIVILGKYSAGLPLELLRIHLKTASKEVLEYLNHY
ncbi:hypothetical protein X975_20818, partial [Stegodyphus mimosarum]